MGNEKSVERGSTKVFGTPTHDHDALTHALGLARGDLVITRWHKIGIPPFERIEAEFQVSATQLGSTVAKLMQLNSSALQVTTEVFPYGILDPMYRVEATLEKSE
jgi:hypothetical protein